MKEFYNEDCMQGMGRYPDKFFDLAIVDPPYGIGIGHTIMLGRGGVKDHLRETIHTYGDSTKALAKQNFIIRSTTPRRRTGDTLMNCNEYQKRGLYGVATFSSTILARRRVS